MNTILAIAFGGALGALARYGANISAFKIWGDGFPYGTLGVNIAGSFAMGVLIAVFAHFWQPPQEIRLFLVTGFLGAFTTFSTFSLDVSVLYDRGDLVNAGIYILASVVFSILALFAGLLMMRVFVS